VWQKLAPMCEIMAKLDSRVESVNLHQTDRNTQLLVNSNAVVILVAIRIANFPEI